MTEILIENNQGKKEIPEEIYDAIKKAVNGALEFEGCEFDAQVSVTIVDNEEICAINKEFRGIDRPTDVLSFPMLEFDEDGNAEASRFDCTEDGMVILGDIILSAERAYSQAEEYGHSFVREMAFLTVHSMLHLLGYDHVDNPEGEKIMNQKQKDIMKKIGITRD